MQSPKLARARSSSLTNCSKRARIFGVGEKWVIIRDHGIPLPPSPSLAPSLLPAICYFASNRQASGPKYAHAHIAHGYRAQDLLIRTSLYDETEERKVNVAAEQG